MDISFGDLDFGARILDTRIGRWLSVDPLQKKYSGLSPYQFCANSPISALDPDGRLIIFINGLWTPGTGIGAPLQPYWTVSNKEWIRQVQDRIGDHADPKYYDGSIGGAEALFDIHGKIHPNYQDHRKLMGIMQGGADAPAIIANLKKGETIKIVTNSMGTAFARGFTQGVLGYVEKQNQRIAAHNNRIQDQIHALSVENLLLATSIKTKENPIPQITNYTPSEINAIKKRHENFKKIEELKSQMKEKISVEFELVVDLSSHQVDLPDKNVKRNYFMITNNLSPLEKGFVQQRSIKGSTNLGNMSVHHSSGAEPSQFPQATSPDPTPKK